MDIRKINPSISTNAIVLSPSQQIIPNGLTLNLDLTNKLSNSITNGWVNIVNAKINSSFNGLRSSNYTVQYSDDNSTWTTAFSGVASNNSSCGIQQNTGSGNGLYGRRRYWRYVEGSAIVSHHPRVSRIILTDINGIDYNLITYVSDNCADSGTYQVGTVSRDFATTTWFDLSPSGLNASGSSVITNQKLNSSQPYTTATTSILNTDTHSIFFSIQFFGTYGRYDKIFGYESGGSDRSPGIWRHPNEKYFHWRYDPSNSGCDFSLNQPSASGTQFVDGVWYYVGVTKNNSTARMYVNGTPLGNATVSNPKTSGTATIRIFQDYSANGAFMKHLHVYNRTISDEEVLYNFNAIKNTLSQ